MGNLVAYLYFIASCLIMYYTGWWARGIIDKHDPVKKCDLCGERWSPRHSWQCKGESTIDTEE